VKTAVQPVKGIIQNIALEFKGFSSAEIGSQEYAAKGAALESLVMSLARLHPRWSPEEETIVPWSEENAHLNRETESSLCMVFEYSEDLFRVWRQINAARPSADSLLQGLPRFVLTLEAMCQCPLES
jgi:hypothetical protein